MLINWSPLNPHLVQSRLWHCDKRFAIVAAGRGSGKTEIALRRLALRFRINNSMHFYGGPTERQAKRVAWRRLLELIPDKWVANINQANMIIESKFNSFLYVAGMDKPHRIEGNQWDGCVLDESADQKPGTFARSVYPALTWRNGWCWRIGVPKRYGVGVNEYKKIFKEAERGEKEDAAAFTWPSSDILPPEAIEAARSMLDEKTFKEQFEASWESATGRIYYSFSEKNVQECPYYPSLRITVGADFNVDPMCWNLGHIIEDEKTRKKELRVFKQIRLRDTNTPATLDYLYNTFPTHATGWTFYGDAAGRQRHTNAAVTDYQLINDDKRFVGKQIYFPQKNPVRKDRFTVANSAFCNAKGERKVFIDPSCKELIRDYEERSWADNGVDPEDDAEIGHAADALDYVMWPEFPIGLEEMLNGNYSVAC